MHEVVIDWIEHGAANQPDKLATVELPSGRRQTYARMHERVGRIAGWLKSLGVEPGDRVGLLALNSSDALDIIFATWRIGAVHLALNFRLTPTELDFIVGNADPKVLIHDRDNAPT
ncbi:MAG: AMP-binding protein, partial [Myxococcales bacterium]